MKLYNKFSEVVSDQRDETSNIKLYRIYRYRIPVSTRQHFSSMEDERVYNQQLREENNGFLFKDATRVIIESMHPLDTLFNVDHIPSPEYIVSQLDTIDRTYPILCDLCSLIYNYTPNMLLAVYNNIDVLLASMIRVSLKPAYVEILPNIEFTRNVLLRSFDEMGNFWIQCSSFLFISPPYVHKRLFAEKKQQILLNPSCMEYIMGTKTLDTWIEPEIIEWIHLQRHCQLTKKRTNMLNDWFRSHSIPFEIWAIIASFMPIQKICIETPRMISEKVKEGSLYGWVDIDTFDNYEGRSCEKVYITSEI